MRQVLLHKYALVFALAAFVLKVCIPFIVLYNISTAQTLAAEGAEPTAQIAICTADGVRWISLDDIANEKEHTSQQQGPYKCPLCYVLTHGLKLAVQQDETLLVHQPFLAGHTYTSGEDNQILAMSRTRAFFSRAPPAPVLL